MNTVRILALAFVIASSNLAMAQESQGNRPNAEQIKEKEYNDLKAANLGLTYDQINSVISIRQQARKQMMTPPPPPPSEGEDDSDTPPPPPTDRKEAKAKADAYMQQQYAAVLKDPVLIEKVNAYYQSREKMRSRGHGGEKHMGNNSQSSDGGQAPSTNDANNE